MTQAATIPLLAGDGTVRAHVLVDRTDASWLSQWTWRLDSHGYARRGAGTYMHRVILGLERGDGRIGDHINANRLDNRRENLRVVSAAGNSQNTVGKRSARSAHRGVSWSSRLERWDATVWLNGRKHYLGSYAEESEAARVAAEFRAQHMPFSREALEVAA